VKKHPTSVEGFDGSLKQLAREICRLRYDKLAELLYYLGEEFVAEANIESKRDRVHLSALLVRTWGIVRALQVHVENVFRFSAPHMKNELGNRGAKLGYVDRWRTGNYTSPLESYEKH
jgi:hypothetical protein